MIELVQRHFYFFAALLTGVYCFAFILFLSSRFPYSTTSRRFAAFLICVLAWTVKDALGEAIGPDLSAQEYLRLTAVLSVFYLMVTPAAFSVFVSIYNAHVSERYQFRFLRETQTILITMLTLDYAIGAVYPPYFYRNFTIASPGVYSYEPGTGILVSFLTIVMFVLIPALVLVAISLRNPRSEAFFFGFGALISLYFIVTTNAFPGSGAIEQVRLGGISIGVFCVFAFCGIKKYGKAFSVTEILKERETLRSIGQSLGQLVKVHDEHEVFRSISECARELSESVYCIILSFDAGAGQFAVRAVARSEGSPPLPRFLQLGTTGPLEANSPWSQSLGGATALSSSLISELFPNLTNAKESEELNHRLGVRQILSYPFYDNAVVKGVVVLLKHHPAPNIDLFELFAVQCALVLKFASHIRELEDKRRLGDQLNQARKMEAVGQLAGGVAHDFNNMLSGIIGYANILRRKFGSSNPVVLRYADSIIDASKRAADLTGQLLAFARKGKYETRPIDTHVIIRQIVRLLERTIDRRIRIWQNLLAEKPIITGDPTQIQNALLNLALNARDAMPEGGDLVFETRNLNLADIGKSFHSSSIEPGDYLVIAIVDTGVGMDEPTKSHLFEPFFTTKEVGKGTGLGLASVYGTVKEHAGHIQVHSETGNGTTMKIFFPAQHPPAQSVHEHSEPEPVRGDGTVLVVDDELVVREVAREMLEDLGYGVHLCSDGAEAVEYFQKHYEEIDIVLLDLIMPHMDGYQCAQELRRIDPQVKIIVSTGYSVRQGTRQFPDAEVAGLVRKPYDSAALSTALAEACGKVPECSGDDALGIS